MRHLKSLIVITSFLFLSNCEKDAEVQTKDYPFVITNPPTVSSNGAELSADIINTGSQEIIKYGFVLGKGINPTIEDYVKLSDDNVNKGIYTCKINSGLIDGNTYYVRAYILTDKCEVYGNERSFVSQGSLPPLINGFEPESGPIGTVVIIEGENFGFLKNSIKVKFGSFEAIVDSVSENIIVVRVPQTTKPEKVQISIETAGMSASSQDSFDIYFPWKRLKDFDAGYLGERPVSFSLNDKGYFGLGYNKTDFWEYDPVTDLFEKKANFPKQIEGYPISFTANNLGYVLFVDATYNTVGWTSNNDTINELWEYNPDNDIWTRKADFPGLKRLHGVGLSINDKGYILGGIYWKDSWDYYPKDLWEYDPFRDEWTRKADFPGSDCAKSFGFSMNGKGYFGIGSSGWSNKLLYEYNPESDTWEYYAAYPGKGYNFINGFSINGKCYLGLGSGYDNDYCSDFWEFNIENKSWKELKSCPVKMSAKLSFMINNKGYIGIGWNDKHDYSKILYEFDPAEN